jgi:hypothetical protein
VRDDKEASCASTPPTKSCTYLLWLTSPRIVISLGRPSSVQKASLRLAAFSRNLALRIGRYNEYSSATAVQ